MSARTMLAVIATVLAMVPLGLVGTASAEPATPYPGSQCFVDGISGTTNIVLQDGVPVVTGCHIKDGAGNDQTVQFASGSCHYVATVSGNRNLVCHKQ